MTTPLRLVSTSNPETAPLAERAAQLAEQYAPRTLVISMHAPVTVVCVTCKAQPGWPCQSPRGWTPRDGFHKPRVRAVEHLSDEEKVAAYATMKARQEQVRADSAEYMRQLEADPVYVAQRDATRAGINAAFAEMEARQRAEENAARARCRDPWVHPNTCTCRTDQETNR